MDGQACYFCAKPVKADANNCPQCGQPQILQGKYRLVGLLGQGGFGIVYEAQDLRLNRRYAIKSIITSSAAAQKQVLEEANILASHARHFRFMPEIYDTWSERDRTFLVMEYIAGPTLADVLEADGPWPAAAIEEFLRATLADLAQLHAAGIIHRDLKPANIKRSAKGGYVLLDFGISKQTSHTMDGAKALSPYYSPPEQVRSERTDQRSDLYSLGATAYHLLTGYPPDPGGMRLASSVPIVPPSMQVAGVSERLNDTLMALLELDPANRPASAEATLALLEGEAAALVRVARPAAVLPALGQTIEAELAPAAPRPAPVRRFSPIWLGGLAFLFLALAGGSWLVSQGRSADQPLAAGAPTATVALAAGAPLPTVAPAAAPEPAATTPTLARAPIEPVAAGEYMVLVADFEPLDGSGREVQRFVVDNLRRTFEQEVPLSNIRVRSTDRIVTGDAEAQQLAEEAGAAVIVWGNYNDQTVILNVQVGSTAAFESIAVPREVLNRTANIQLELSDPRGQSVAPQVLVALNALHTADGNGYEVMRVVVIRSDIGDQGIPSSGAGSAAHFDRYLSAYFDQTEAARAEINQALQVDAANPILYVLRSVANVRLGQYEDARQDSISAQRLGDPGWTSPLYVDGFRTYITGDLTETLGIFNQIVAARPNDWFPANFRGVVHYLRRDYPAATADFDRAIGLGPNANFPYVFATMLALRAGDIDQARSLMATVQAEYPDPTLGNRTIEGLFGPNTPNLFGPTFSAFGKLALGSYTEALSDTAAALKVEPDFADLHFMEGYAHCNMGRYAEAEAAYTRALELDPTFTMLYLLRAEARQRQQNLAGALADIGAVQSSAQAAQFAPLVTQAQAGQLTCETFLSDR